MENDTCRLQTALVKPTQSIEASNRAEAPASDIACVSETRPNRLLMVLLRVGCLLSPRPQAVPLSVPTAQAKALGWHMSSVGLTSKPQPRGRSDR